MKAATTQGGKEKKHQTPKKEVVKAPPPEREESTQHQPKEGETQPSFGGASFPRSFWPLLPLPCSLECVASRPSSLQDGATFPPRFFSVALLFSSLLLGCVVSPLPPWAVMIFSPSFGVAPLPSSSSCVCIHGKLFLWMCIFYVGGRRGTTTQTEEGKEAAPP